MRTLHEIGVPGDLMVNLLLGEVNLRSVSSKGRQILS